MEFHGRNQYKYAGGCYLKKELTTHGIPNVQEDTKKELIEHVEKVCAALAFLRDCDPDLCLKGGPHYAKWVRHMNNLNSRRVRLGMASEYLHNELNMHNDQVIAAGRDEQWKVMKEER